MYDSYNAAIILWPATPLPANVAAQLQNAGVDLTAKKVKDGRLAARRTPDGTVVLDLTFSPCQYGLTDLEALLATLRLARISYVAWDAREGEIAGTGRSFDPDSGIEQNFTVMADGEPVLTASDLEEFQGHDAGELLDAIRSWLRLPVPNDLSDLAENELTILTVPDEEDEHLETSDAGEEPWGARLLHAGG